MSGIAPGGTPLDTTPEQQRPPFMVFLHRILTGACHFRDLLADPSTLGRILPRVTHRTVAHAGSFRANCSTTERSGRVCCDSPLPLATLASHSRIAIYC